MPDIRATYDVIVLGGGTAGLAAAIAAHEHGLSALLIEKAPVLGGISVHSYGLVWVGGNHLAARASTEDNRDDQARGGKTDAQAAQEIWLRANDFRH